MTGIPAAAEAPREREARRLEAEDDGRAAHGRRAQTTVLERLPQALGQKLAVELALGERAAVPPQLCGELGILRERDERLRERLASRGGT